MKLHYQVYTLEDYEEDKNNIIKLAENNIKSKNIYNKLWNIDTWDLCFTSFYVFPNNKTGFLRQYYLPKLMPFVDYLTNIGNIDNIHIYIYINVLYVLFKILNILYIMKYL